MKGEWKATRQSETFCDLGPAVNITVELTRTILRHWEALNAVEKQTPGSIMRPKILLQKPEYPSLLVIYLFRPIQEESFQATAYP